MNIREKLLMIQSKLKCSKNQENKFGKYKYRSCEDILEAVKPLCIEHKAITVLNDELVEVSGNAYIKATASLIDTEVDDAVHSVQCSAYAREAEKQAGMAPAQVTGSTSSYARKYALNGLFCIDDTKDDDYNNTGNGGQKPEQKKEQKKEPLKTQPLATAFLDEMQSIKMILNKKTGDDSLYYYTLKEGEGKYEKSNQVPKKSHKACLKKFNDLVKEVNEL